MIEARQRRSRREVASNVSCSKGLNTHLLSSHSSQNSDLTTARSNHVALLHDFLSLLEIRSRKSNVLSLLRSRSEDSNRDFFAVWTGCSSTEWGRRDISASNSTLGLEEREGRERT